MKTIKIKHKVKKIFPYGDVLVPVVPVKNKSKLEFQCTCLEKKPCSHEKGKTEALNLFSSLIITNECKGIDFDAEYDIGWKVWRVRVFRKKGKKK